MNHFNHRSLHHDQFYPSAIARKHAIFQQSLSVPFRSCRPPRRYGAKRGGTRQRPCQAGQRSFCLWYVPFPLSPPLVLILVLTLSQWPLSDLLLLVDVNIQSSSLNNASNPSTTPKSTAEPICLTTSPSATKIPPPKKFTVASFTVWAVKVSIRRAFMVDVPNG